MKIKIFLSAVLFLVITLFSGNTNAHPGWGIVFDSNGNLFFTDIINRTIWKLDRNNELTKFSEEKWSHQLIIDENDNLYLCNEEFKMGNGWNSVIKLSPTGKETYLIEPVKYSDQFSGSVMAIDEDENIYYEFKGKVYKRNPDGEYSLYHKENFNGIKNLHWYKSSLVVVSDDKIFKIKNGKIDKVIVENYRNTNPVDGAYGGRYNSSYGIDFDENENLYIAYYGNSRILKVNTSGKIEELYKSRGNWFPVGVKHYNGSLYILEEGHAPEDGPTALRVIRLLQNGKQEVIVSLGRIGNSPVSTH